MPHRFYLVNGEDGWYPFGTDCSHGDPTRKAFCISGRCLVSTDIFYCGEGGRNVGIDSINTLYKLTILAYK